jgi:uncharacterized protein
MHFRRIGNFLNFWKNTDMLPDPWRFPRPDTAAHYAGLLADAPRRPLAIFGPRQIGKTHFLTHDLAEAAEARGWSVLYADLWGQPDPLGSVNTALAAMLRSLQTRTGRTAVTSVGALGVSVGLAAPVALVAPQDPAALLATQFAELRRLQPDQPVLIMLDEAQTLVRSGAGDAAMKAIRSLFNSNPGAVLLLFTGSSKSQLMALVGDHSKTAFKLAAHMDFPLLGLAFVTFIASRIKTISQRDIPVVDLDWAFSQLLHRPGEMIDFARFMVTEVPQVDVRTALEAFKQRNQPDLAMQTRFAGCTPLQQALMLEVASGAKLFSRETRERLAASVRQPTPIAPASVHNTLSQLEAMGILAKRELRGQYAFEDEQFRDWVDHVARDQATPRRRT